VKYHFAQYVIVVDSIVIIQDMPELVDVFKQKSNEMTRVPINPQLLIWARERAGIDMHTLAHHFPKLAEWEAGTVQPTLHQLEEFARTVHVAIGYLFLPTPPNEPLPIADFRTIGGYDTPRHSPNLLDTIYLCQQRQDWFRDYARMHALPTHSFVGSATIHDAPEDVAHAMRQILAINIAERQQQPSWTHALRQLMLDADRAGILVMASGIVGSNSHRKLSVEEFRGFALTDTLAPLIFINTADSKAAQMFTIGHELAHIWLGESGISNTTIVQSTKSDSERWCNAVAAELLMPLAMVKKYRIDQNQITAEMQKLAQHFKVSTLVSLRRLYDAGFIDQSTLWNSYHDELTRIQNEQKTGNGGNFYRTLATRTSARFARAVLSSTLEGHTLFQEAFQLLGVRKTATFYAAARELEVLK
jgi:Zn-dependent peptidase ImmA (M78 family)